MDPPAVPTPIETTGPRPSPPPPLRATVPALLALHDRGLLDARTTRAALGGVRGRATLAEVLEGAGVPRTLQEKADELLRPLATSLDGAATVALALVPPALAALAGELARLQAAAAWALLAVGAGALLLAPPRWVKAGAAATATVAAVALLQPASPELGSTAFRLVLLLLGMASLAARPVGACARSGATGLLAGAAIETVRALLS